MKAGSLFFLAVALLPALAPADEPGKTKVILSDGTMLESKDVGAGRAGSVMVNRELAPGVNARISYDPKVVAQIEFPENPRLKRALELLEQGHAAAALAMVDPLFKERQNLARVKGNDMAASAIVKVKALGALRREQEAREVIDELTKNADDPEVVRGALVEAMAIWARTGQYQKADEFYDRAIAESTNPTTLAAAWCHKGDALLALEDYDAALLAYLRVPTLSVDESDVLPQALLGSARAYLGLEQLIPATAALQQILRNHPAAPAAAEAKLELQKIRPSKVQTAS